MEVVLYHYMSFVEHEYISFHTQNMVFLFSSEVYKVEMGLRVQYPTNTKYAAIN